MPDSGFTKQADCSSVELVELKVGPRPPFDRSTLSSSDSDDESPELKIAVPKMPPSDSSDSDTGEDVKGTEMSPPKGSHPAPPSDESSDSASDSPEPIRSSRVLMSPPAEVSTSDEESDRASPVEPPVPRICLVEARKTWTASDRKKQLSFDEGDIIQVLKTPGKWHLGRLYLSDSHPITGQARYFPSNFVKSVSMEDMETLIQARAERDRHLPQAPETPVESDSDSSD